MKKTNFNDYIRAKIIYNKNSFLLNREVFIRLDAKLFDIGKAINTAIGSKDKAPYYFEDSKFVYSSLSIRNRRQYCLSKQKIVKYSKFSYLDTLFYLPGNKIYFNNTLNDCNEFKIVFTNDIFNIESNKIMIVESGNSIGLFNFEKHKYLSGFRPNSIPLNREDLRYINESIEETPTTSHNNTKKLINRIKKYSNLNVEAINKKEANRFLYENVFTDSKPSSAAHAIKSVGSNAYSTPIDIMRFMVFVYNLEDSNFNVLTDFVNQLRNRLIAEKLLTKPQDSFSNELLIQYYGVVYMYIDVLRKDGKLDEAITKAFTLYKLDPKDRFDFKHVLDSINCRKELENYIINELHFNKNDYQHIGNICLKHINDNHFNLALTNANKIMKNKHKLGCMLKYGNFVNTGTLTDLEFITDSSDLAEAGYFLSLHQHDFGMNSKFERFVYEQSSQLSKKVNLSDFESQIFLAVLLGHEHAYLPVPNSKFSTISVINAGNYISENETVIDLKEPFKTNEQFISIIEILAKRGLLIKFCSKFQISDKGLALLPYYKKTVPTAFKLLDHAANADISIE